VNGGPRLGAPDAPHAWAPVHEPQCERPGAHHLLPFHERLLNLRAHSHNVVAFGNTRKVSRYDTSLVITQPTFVDMS